MERQRALFARPPQQLRVGVEIARVEIGVGGARAPNVGNQCEIAGKLDP